jgi:hypothetical protein
MTTIPRWFRIPTPPRATSAAVIGLFLLAWSTAATAQNGYDWGRNWKGASEVERARYLAGFQEASLRLAEIGWEMSGRLPIPPKDQPQISRARLSHSQRKELADLFQRRYEAIAIERFGERAVEDGITQLYEDAANSLILPSKILEIAILRLSGAPQSEVDLELQILREVVAPPLPPPRPRH